MTPAVSSAATVRAASTKVSARGEVRAQVTAAPQNKKASAELGQVANDYHA